MSNKICYIMVAPSGSGKSTVAKKLVAEDRIFSTDNLFMIDGEYQFDFNKLGKNHKKNFFLFKRALEDGKPVCCDNTNLRQADINKYSRAAETAGYEVFLKTGGHPTWQAYIEHKDNPDCSEISDENIAAFLFENSTHNVPKDVITQMVNNFWKVWK